MSLWRQLTHGLRALSNRPGVADELDDEVRDFYDRARADLLREGLSPDEAARAARRELGDEEHAREALGSYGWEHVVETTLADLSHSLRRLRRAPSFALTAVLTLALGIGASTAIFSAVRPILFEPLPYPDAERLVTLTDIDGAGGPLAVTYGTYLEVAVRSRSFTGLAASDRWQPALVGAGESERLTGELVTASHFDVLGVAPAIGRDFEAGDDTFGGPRVAIVSDALARRRFGSARAILNGTIELDDVDYTVIGVMPGGFENVLAPNADVWAPRQFREQAPFESAEWGHHMQMIGRLAPGVSLEQAQSELATIGAEPVAELPRPPWALFERGLAIESLQGSATAGAESVLLALLGAVTLLLVIACANVTNLLLARCVGRRAELAVRGALGAGHGRLVRQLLTESAVLAVIGGAFGFAVATLGIQAILALAPAELPRIDAVGLDWPAFGFAVAVTAFVAIGIGLAPALRGARPNLSRDLHSGARVTAASHHLLRRGLVVTEVALALVLLTGAGLLLRSVDRLLATVPGFDAANVLTMQLVATSYLDEPPAATMQYFEKTLEAVRAVPGITSAAFASQLPLSGDNDGYGVEFESASQPFPNNTSGALRYVVTPEWFQTMRIPLLRGRLLGPEDRPSAPGAVLISESLARRWFGDRNPIGERMRIGPDMGRADRPWDVIVGVVGDVKQVSLALASPDAFYKAMGQWPWVDAVQSLAVRTDGDAAALAPDVRRAIWSVDSTPPIERIATMEDLLVASEAARRFALLAFSVFAIAALVLAGLGLYGVIAGSVVERTREIGLRSALGATPAQLLTLVVRQGMMLAGVGAVIGLVGSIVAARGLDSLLYEVTSLDPLTYGGVIVLVAGVAMIACWLPATRAARVDATIALRAE
jgi:predicted permease